MNIILALGLALSLMFNLHMIERATRHADTLTVCINGGSFTVVPKDSPTERGRIVHCTATDTHEGAR